MGREGLHWPDLCGNPRLMRDGGWRGATPSHSQRSNVVRATREASPWWGYRLQDQEEDDTWTHAKKDHGVNGGASFRMRGLGGQEALRGGMDIFFFSNICLSVFSLILYFVCNKGGKKSQTLNVCKMEKICFYLGTLPTHIRGPQQAGGVTDSNRPCSALFGEQGSSHC